MEDASYGIIAGMLHHLANCAFVVECKGAEDCGGWILIVVSALFSYKRSRLLMLGQGLSHKRGCWTVCLGGACHVVCFGRRMAERVMVQLHCHHAAAHLFDPRAVTYFGAALLVKSLCFGSHLQCVGSRVQTFS